MVVAASGRTVCVDIMCCLILHYIDLARNDHLPHPPSRSVVRKCRLQNNGKGNYNKSTLEYFASSLLAIYYLTSRVYAA